MKFGSHEKLVNKKCGKDVVQESALYDAVKDVHTLEGHGRDDIGGRDTTALEVNKRNTNVSRRVVHKWLSTYQTCEKNKTFSECSDEAYRHRGSERESTNGSDRLDE